MYSLDCQAFFSTYFCFFFLPAEWKFFSVCACVHDWRTRIGHLNRDKWNLQQFLFCTYPYLSPLYILYQKISTITIYKLHKDFREKYIFIFVQFAYWQNTLLCGIMEIALAPGPALARRHYNICWVGCQVFFKKNFTKFYF